MERVRCAGGPLDDGELDIVPGAPEVEVTMADGTRHRYVRVQPAAGPGPARFAWRDRRRPER